VTDRGGESHPRGSGNAPLATSLASSLENVGHVSRARPLAGIPDELALINQRHD
jgi:hypothetical protein